MDKTASDDVDALVAAIWGRDALAKPAALDSKTRAAQNQALSFAIKAYLQSYLDDGPDLACAESCLR